MKKIILALFLVGIMIGSAYAVVDLAYTVSLTTNYQKVTVNTPGTGHCVPIAVWTADGTGFYLAKDAAGTGERFIPGVDTSFGGWSNDCVKIDSDGTLLWAKAASGTPTLYVDIGRGD